jgi:hypothetical protein
MMPEWYHNHCWSMPNGMIVIAIIIIVVVVVVLAEPL